MKTHRKLISILFLGLYLVFSMGFVVNSHYCHGKLVDISIYQEPDSCCDANDAANDCCQNESEIVFLEDEQKPIQKNNKDFAEYSLIYHSTPFNCISNIDIIQLKLGFTDEIPPPKIPNHILNCSFTYYG